MSIAFIRSLEEAAPYLEGSHGLSKGPLDAGALLHRELSESEAELSLSELMERKFELEENNVKVSALSIFLIFIALIIGTFTKLLTKKLHFPYTPALTFVGIIIASIDLHVFRHNYEQVEEEVLVEHGIIRQTADTLHFPVPELIFLCFLPALIFESSFNSDWYVFKRQFCQILVLAGVLLVYCAFATAASMFYILGYNSETNNMSFMGCLLFGAIISATDPVAVVALLKELGINKRISTLIEGESLLNDGTAVVLFIVIRLLEEGEEMTAL